MPSPVKSRGAFVTLLESVALMVEVLPSLSEELAAFAVESMSSDWEKLAATVLQSEPPRWMDEPLWQRWAALEHRVPAALDATRRRWPVTFENRAALRRTLDALTVGASLTSLRPPLSWNDPALAVRSDPPLRARYRRLQSWYREHVLGAPYGFSTDPRRRAPVGSTLSKDAVAADPALNFFGDPEVLAYVNERVPQVKAADGTLDEDRLRHNMLSSMPMAFSLAGVLRRAPDRVQIVNTLFGLDAAEVTGVDAEWAPDPDMHLHDRTAFDLVIHYRTRDGHSAVMGVETKYTEPLSQTRYDSDPYRHLTDSSHWFTPDAAHVLVGSATNQLWRHTMLTANIELHGDAHLATAAVVGLRDDTSLWASVAVLHRHMTVPDRVVPITWEDLIGRLDGSSLWSFGALFAERYLDTTPIDQPDHQPLVVRPRRSTNTTARIWAFRDWSAAPRPGPEATGDEPDWGRWVPTMWRAINDSTHTVTIPPRPTADVIETAAWWSPLLHLALYSFAWPDPAVALDRWDQAGRPLDDPRLSLIDTIWGRHLDVLLHHLWTNRPNLYESTDGDELGWAPTPPRPDIPEAIARPQSRASWAGPNPADGGSDPLHLTGHVSAPFRRAPVRTELVEGDLGIAGPPRATLVVDRYEGWYRALHEYGAALPANTQRHSWRVDVIVRPIGLLGTYRRSHVTGRWFAGRHRHHVL